jgi:hypothetical protein
VDVVESTVIACTAVLVRQVLPGKNYNSIRRNAIIDGRLRSTRWTVQGILNARDAAARIVVAQMQTFGLCEGGHRATIAVGQIPGADLRVKRELAVHKDHISDEKSTQQGKTRDSREGDHLAPFS